MADDENENEFDFEALGLLGRTRSEGAQPILNKLLGRDDHIAISPEDAVRRGPVKDPLPMACNQATMECLRGPCRYLCSQTLRMQAHGEDRVYIARARECHVFAGKADDLVDENVFECGYWWPRTLAFVPESLWTILRKPVRKLWERILKARGYDFSWKWWEDDVFEQQDEGKALGTAPASVLRRRGKYPDKNIVEPEPGTTLFNVG